MVLAVVVEQFRASNLDPYHRGRSAVRIQLLAILFQKKGYLNCEKLTFTPRTKKIVCDQINTHQT